MGLAYVRIGWKARLETQWREDRSKTSNVKMGLGEGDEETRILACQREQTRVSGGVHD